MTPDERDFPSEDYNSAKVCVFLQTSRRQYGQISEYFYFMSLCESVQVGLSILT